MHPSRADGALAGNFLPVRVDRTHRTVILTMPGVRNTAISAGQATATSRPSRCNASKCMTTMPGINSYTRVAGSFELVQAVVLPWPHVREFRRVTRITQRWYPSALRRSLHHHLMRRRLMRAIIYEVVFCVLAPSLSTSLSSHPSP
jgi:hypothetical protein